MGSTDIEKHAGRLPAAALAAWALILLIAFLWNRGSDVGQIGRLTANLGGGPVLGLGFFDTLNGFCAATLVVVAWAGLGKMVRRLAFDAGGAGRTFRLAVDAAVGAAIWSLVWFFLGLAGGYDTAAAAVTTLLGIGMFVIPARRIARDHEEGGSARLDWAILFLILFIVLLVLTASLAPPIAKDTLLYHFALPKAFIAQHSNAVVTGNIASYLPLGAEMHYVWAMLLGGAYSPRAAEVAAGGVSFWFFVLLVATVYGWARNLLNNRRWALVAALVVASVPTAYHVASSGYVDDALALYVTLGVYALSRWWTNGDRAPLGLLTICLTASLSIKLTSIFIFVAVMLIELVKARASKSDGKPRPILTAGLGALLVAAALASPWYLKTWKETGSPVFPFYMSIVKGNAAGWDVDRSNLFQAMNSAYGGENKTALDYLVLPWNISVVAQPEKPESFDGVIGVAFLIGLPILLFALWKLEPPVDVKIGAGVAGIYFLFWLSSSQQLRYLFPVLPILAICIASSVWLMAKKVKTIETVGIASLTAASAAGLLTIIAWFCQPAPLRIDLGGETRGRYLERNLDYYPFYETLNTDTPPDAKVWLIDMRRDTYNLDRQAVSDYLFEDWTFRKMLWEARSIDELRSRVAAMNVQYILSRYDFLFDYDRSSLVDDKRPRAENEAKLKMAHDLLLDGARSVKADDKFSLVKVF